jgi:hypothetical protein
VFESKLKLGLLNGGGEFVIITYERWFCTSNHPDIYFDFT